MNLDHDTPPPTPESRLEENLRRIESVREQIHQLQAKHEAEIDSYRKALDMVGKLIQFLTDEQPESDEKFDHIHNAKTWSYYTDHGKASELFQQTIPNTVDIAMIARWGWRALRDKPQPGRISHPPSA
jgi:hypothetical protein